MSHDIYQDWLFSEQELTPDQALELQVHLQQCPACNQLALAWSQVEQQLERAPMVEPAAGFTDRWQKHLAVESLRLERRQGLRTLAFSLGAAVLVLIVLIVLAWPVLQSPKVLLWSYVYQLVGLVSLASGFTDWLAEITRLATGGIPLLWWVLFVGVVCQMGVLWIVSYRLLTIPRRVTL